MIEWRTCAGFPDYEVSEYGSIRRITPNYHGRSGHIMKARSDRDGYLRVKLFAHGKPAPHRAIHRLVLATFVGAQPTLKHEVAHADGSKKNNHYTNLRWATTTENQRDRFKHGTDLRGIKHPLHKLNPDAVKEIRTFCRDGKDGVLDRKKMAFKYGVSRQLVLAVMQGKVWGYLPQDQACG